MEHEFWHERWRNEQIGFHQPQGNPLLQQHWPDLGIPPESDVFVPLCGKSRDMAWLAQRGHQVVGCELSARAVEAFFREQNLEPRVETGERFTRYAAGPFTVLCGDFFQIEADDLSPATALYDRAALIAMPESMRDAYAAHLLSLLAADAPGLLITLEYDQSRMQGPPFSVSAEEVERLFGERYGITMLAEVNALADSPRFAQAGLTGLWERAYRLSPRP